MKPLFAVTALLMASMWLTGKEPSSPVIAHEWGTFTSVALDTGAPARWAPWTGPADLPCFVHRESARWKFELSGLVRMETPVIYFYSDQPATVSVNVDFPKGLITEWYPQAKVRSAQSATSLERGGVRWDNVAVIPGSNVALPTSKASHYFAARNTDAAPLRAGQENEKLLFYRGVGDFAVPLHARYPGDGLLEIRNVGPDTIPVVIAFENQGGKVGYRVVRDLKGEVSVAPPSLTANVTALHSLLARELAAAGLYGKEAAAMIETWRDSWFEVGMRVFYVLPRAEVDRVLPLQIKPAPAQVAREAITRRSAQCDRHPRRRIEQSRSTFVQPIQRTTLDQVGDLHLLQSDARQKIVQISKTAFSALGNDGVDAAVTQISYLTQTHPENCGLRVADCGLTGDLRLEIKA